MELLNQVADAIAVAIAVTKSRLLQEEMLQKTRRQAAALQAKQSELAASNSKLTKQAKALQVSESKLQQEREELRVANEELEAQTQLLREREQGSYGSS